MANHTEDFSGVFANASVPAILLANAQRVKSGFVQKLLAALGAIPFARDAAAAYFCAFDPATPPRVKAVLLAALAYFVLPLDAVPDLFALIGFTDDATVLALALAMVGGAIQPAHRARAQRLLAGEAISPAPGD